MSICNSMLASHKTHLNLPLLVSPVLIKPSLARLASKSAGRGILKLQNTFENSLFYHFTICKNNMATTLSLPIT